MVREYDPMNVNVIADGDIMTGFADGTFVSVEQDEENFSTMVGAKGEVSRAKNANKLGTINLTLKHTSPSNARLNQLARSGRLFPVSVVDLNDGSSAGGREAWVEKPANKDWGKEETTREWTIKVAQLEVNE